MNETTDDQRGLDSITRLIVLFYVQHGQIEFKRAALAYFSEHLHEFLALTPEQHQDFCRMGGIDEAGFVAACQELMMAGTRRSGLDS